MAADAPWAWVRTILDNVHAFESRCIRGGIAAGRTVADATTRAATRAATAAKGAQHATEAAVKGAIDWSVLTTYHASLAYPEVAVGALTLGSCALRGYHQEPRTYLGAAPRRAVFTTLVLSALFSRPLAIRWGETISGASQSASGALKSVAVSVGALD